MRKLLQERARLLATIRTFFRSKNILEVETPILSRAGVCDPHLQNLNTYVNSRRFFLQTSPEFAMKRLLSAGSGDIYQIGKAFRNDEAGRLHNPEFTMIEWYRTGFDYRQLMDEVEELVSILLPVKDFERVTWREVYLRATGIDPMQVSTEELKTMVGEVAGQTSRQDLLDLIMAVKVLPALPGAVFIHDYPVDQASMAKIRDGIAERFELVIDGVELANGYTELTDPFEQEQRFRYENQQRRIMGKEEMPLDQHLLEAMQKGLPECAGVAMGFDRLVMLALGKQSLAEVMPFTAEFA